MNRRFEDTVIGTVIILTIGIVGLLFFTFFLMVGTLTTSIDYLNKEARCKSLRGEFEGKSQKCYKAREEVNE
jgi:hypothetical protein|nr:MAG TPA: hypothetical protein [Caudoviricetes sp.]